VQPGAYRVYSTTNGSGSLEDVAFTNPDGSMVLFVLNAASARSTFAVTWNGSSFTDTLPAGAVATYEWSVPVPDFPAIGAINAASPAAGLSPGELFSIYGVNLAAEVQKPLLLPLPPTMAAASVQINGIEAPLLYVSPQQINAGVSASQTVTIAAAGPAIFTLYGSQEAAALNQDYSVNSQNNPAAAGQAVLLFGTGLGAVSPAVPTGVAAGSDPLSSVTAKVTATVGGTPATVLFAGLAPGFAGLWQVNVQLPAGASGAATVTLSVGGVATSPVTVWVQ
jgi:hypothetical protein